MPNQAASDVAFSPSVKAAQTRLGSRALYRRVEEGEGWETTITPDLRAFIAERDSFYFATANREGQPYVQHRGGPKGFLQVVDEKTLGFVDYSGNRQYISVGNLAENDRAFIFLMDYAHRQRIKIWGRARIVEGDAALVEKLKVPYSKGKPERVVLFDVGAWDANCPQHIPQKIDAADARAAIESLQARITELEKENARLRSMTTNATSR